MKAFTEIDFELAEDIVRGLTAKTKCISSKYFYDEKGSKIFEEIMNLPSYYLTRAESAILRLYVIKQIQQRHKVRYQREL